MQGGHPLPGVQGAEPPWCKHESANSGGFGGREERRADIIQHVQERSDERDGESAQSDRPPDWKVPDWKVPD